MHSEWQDRVKHWVRTLRDDFYEPLGEIRWEAFRTMDHLSPEEALQGHFTSAEPGFIWGKTWEYCWFRGTVILPKAAEGKRIVMNLDAGGESTVFVNGKAFGNYRAAWVDEPHQFIEDNCLAVSGKEGDTYEILMETYAGHFYPEAPTGGCATGPVLPGAYTDPKKEGARCVLGTSTFGVWNEDAYQLFMDVDTLGRLLETMDSTTLRAAKIAKALEKFTLIVDFEQPREARIASYKEAREALRPLMEAKNGSTMPVFYAIGNAHLDLAWLWPMEETHRKTERTFAAQLRLLEEYPEYKFIQSQPASYEMCRKYYPELFERIKEAIRAGQWIADGAMWVEPDTNMTSGESLVRQLIHGKRYYKEELGVDSQVLWLPDTFGYTAASSDPARLRRKITWLPRRYSGPIMKGISSLITILHGKAWTAPAWIPSCPPATPTARTRKKSTRYGKTGRRSRIWMHSSCPSATGTEAAARPGITWNMHCARRTWRAA